MENYWWRSIKLKTIIILKTIPFPSQYANMSHCNLSHTNLNYCCLERADLQYANLECAQLVSVRGLCANMVSTGLTENAIK